MVAVDPMYSTTACVTLDFIGFNYNAPTISYEPAGIAHFVEGQSEPVRIVNGSLTVEDEDHPTRYVCTCVCTCIVCVFASACTNLNS